MAFSQVACHIKPPPGLAPSPSQVSCRSRYSPLTLLRLRRSVSGCLCGSICKRPRQKSSFYKILDSCCRLISSKPNALFLLQFLYSRNVPGTFCGRVSSHIFSSEIRVIPARLARNHASSARMISLIPALPVGLRERERAAPFINAQPNRLVV